MKLVLDVPESIAQALSGPAGEGGTADSGRAGVLLAVGAALAGGPEAGELGAAMRSFLSRRALPAERVAVVMREMVDLLASSGAPGDATRWAEALNGERTVQYETGAQRAQREGLARVAERPSAFGKYAGMTDGSEEMARRKQAEIDLEDRPRR